MRQQAGDRTTASRGQNDSKQEPILQQAGDRTTASKGQNDSKQEGSLSPATSWPVFLSTFTSRLFSFVAVLKS
ncbi:MAG: hypothetical protein J6L60_02830 [Bacteroidaceae bacterium]|nr:hypothetical protein [Bacteroidaceae bacterium]